MTVQEAIDYLNKLWGEVWNEDSDGYEYAKAIDMAIEALQQGCEKVAEGCEPILTEEERSEVLNAIDDVLHGYQVMGYEDNDGMFFKVLINKMERGEADET